MNRPTDKTTGMVVAEWKNKPTAIWNTHGEDDPYFYTNDTPKGKGMCVLGPDPRDCHETAMELLHHTMSQVCCTLMVRGTTHWSVMLDPEESGAEFGEALAVIPISGPDFRYAIVNLASQVMEIKDD